MGQAHVASKAAAYPRVEAISTRLGSRNATCRARLENGGAKWSAPGRRDRRWRAESAVKHQLLPRASNCRGALDPDHDLALDAAALELAMGIADPLQRKDAVDERLELAAFDQGGHRLDLRLRALHEAEVQGQV